MSIKFTKKYIKKAFRGQKCSKLGRNLKICQQCSWDGNKIVWGDSEINKLLPLLTPAQIDMGIFKVKYRQVTPHSIRNQTQIALYL